MTSKPGATNRYTPWKTRVFCTHCNTFYYNNKIQQQKHESSPRHQNALQRLLDNARNKESKERQENVKLAMELQKIDRVAQGAFKRDVREGRVSLDERQHVPAVITVPSTNKTKKKTVTDAFKTSFSTADIVQQGKMVKHHENIDDKRLTQGIPGAWHIVDSSASSIASETITNHSLYSSIAVKSQVNQIDEDPDDLTLFTITEKKIQSNPIDTVNNPEDIVFKKRKRDSSAKTRNIRKKTDLS